MPIYNSESNANIFTGVLKPLVIPYGQQDNSSYANRLLTQSDNSNSEEFDEILGIKTSTLNNGMYGQNRVVNYQMMGLEQEKRRLREEAFNVLMNSSSEKEKNDAMSNFQRGLSGLKMKAMELSILSEELKDDRSAINKDYDYASSSGQLYTPTLISDIGSLVASPNENKFADGSTMAQNNLWNSASQGLAAVRGGRAISKFQYMNEMDNNTMVDSNGRPIRYRGFTRSNTSDKYVANLKGLMDVKGSRNGDSYSIVDDNGNVTAISDRDMQDLIDGKGYVKTTTKSNASALNATIQKAFNLLSNEDRNRAFEDLLASGEYSGSISYRGMTKNENIAPTTYAGLVEELQKTRYRFENSTKQGEREMLHRRGLAISDQIIKGMKMQVYRDATDYKARNLETSVTREIKASTDKYIDKVAVDAAMAALNPRNVSVLPTASYGLTVWDNKTLKTYQNGISAYTNSTQLQNTYVKGLGIDFTRKDYVKKPNNILDLTNTFLLGSIPHDTRMMDEKSKQLMKEWKIVGLDNNVRVLPPIENGEISKKSAPTTYIGVRVIIGNASKTYIQIPERKEYTGGPLLNQHYGSVKYVLGNEEASIKKLVKAGMLQGVKKNENGDIEAVVMVPMHSEGMFDDKPTLRNVSMMNNQYRENYEGQLRNPSNIFKAEDTLGETTNDDYEWHKPLENLDSSNLQENEGSDIQYRGFLH